MSNARDLFFDQMRTLRGSIFHEFLVDGPANDYERNKRARIFRNGLAVMGFCAFEDFLKRRTREILALLSGSDVLFSALTEDLRFLATVRALDGVRNRARLVSTKQDRIDFVQHQARKIGSSLFTPFEFSDYVFGYDSSNLAWEHLRALLSAMSFPDPASGIGELADRCGVGALGRIGTKRSFESLAEARHLAAHDPAANVQPSNLEDYYIGYMGIAVGFDGIISSICKKALDAGAAFNTTTHRFDLDDLKIYFIDGTDKKTVDYTRYGAKRYNRRNVDIEDARLALAARARKELALVVERDLRKFPVSWTFPGLQ